jgi:hypothetical protein
MARGRRSEVRIPNCELRIDERPKVKGVRPEEEED